MRGKHPMQSFHSCQTAMMGMKISPALFVGKILTNKLRLHCCQCLVSPRHATNVFKFEGAGPRKKHWARDCQQAPSIAVFVPFQIESLKKLSWRSPSHQREALRKQCSFLAAENACLPSILVPSLAVKIVSWDSESQKTLFHKGHVAMRTTWSGKQEGGFKQP